MFESIVGRQRAERRLGSGALVSIAVHAAVLALALWWLPKQHAPPPATRGVPVTFFAAPEIAGAGSPAAAAAALEQPTARASAKPDAPRVNKQKTGAVRATPENKPAASADQHSGETLAAEPSGASTSSRQGAVAAGSTGHGTQAGLTAGSIPGNQRFEVVPFGPGMTRPKLLSGPAKPNYPREARIARVAGTVIARCVINLRGTLQACRLLKRLPYLDEAVLETLAAQRYTPLTFQGKATAVEYTFTFTFKLPEE
jgi:periplasmic protein TonB